MNVLTRKQFRHHWNSVRHGLGNSNSPLWAWENHIKVYPRWFVSVRPILNTEEQRKEFMTWTTLHCRGKILCYSSNETEEWFGFTHHADIMFWLLRWG